MAYSDPAFKQLNDPISAGELNTYANNCDELVSVVSTAGNQMSSGSGVFGATHALVTLVHGSSQWLYYRSQSDTVSARLAPFVGTGDAISLPSAPSGGSHDLNQITWLVVGRIYTIENVHYAFEG